MSSGFSETDTIAILNERYHLVKKIGKGETSTVYLGYDIQEKSNELFAFKILRNSTILFKMNRKLFFINIYKYPI